MPFQISCPECNRRLTADESSIGMMVACSSCGARFAVDKPDAVKAAKSGSESAPKATVKKKGAAKFKGIAALPTPAVVPPSSQTNPSLTPPNAGAGPPTSKAPNKAGDQPNSHAWPPSAGKQPPENQPPPSVTQTAQPPAAPIPAKATSQKKVASPKPQPTPPAAAPSTPNRSVQRAKFVTVDPAETNIQLGADGNLPELVLQKNRSPEEEDEATAAGKTPWMMIIALLVSFGASVMLLVVPMGDGPAESRDQRGAREVIADFYIRNTFNPNAPPEEYQNTLRRALRAHDQGDYDEEQRLYRQTLDQLASENLNELRGLTGVPAGDDHPSDTMLRKLLAELLRD